MSEEREVMDIEALARSILGEGAVLRRTTFSSGSVALDIWIADHFATVQGRPAHREWGVSFDPPDDGGFRGHDRVVGTAEEALEEVRRALADPGHV